MERRVGSLRIGLLGGFRVEAGGVAVDRDAWRLRKSQHLVKLLALSSPHYLHREQLMNVLWPDLGPEAAANQLRKAVHGARRALDAGGVLPDRFLARDGETLVLTGDSLEVDVPAFEEAVEAARRRSDLGAYRHAAGLYRGELLPEDRYEEWAVQPRERLRALHVACLSELAGLLTARAEFDEAGTVLRTVVESDPTHEDAHVSLMRVYALAGRRGAAMMQFETLRDTLDRALGVAPGPAAQHLYEVIRAGEGLELDIAGGLWERVGDLRLVSGDSHGAATAFRRALAHQDDLGADRDTGRLQRKSAQAHLAHHDTAAAVEALAAAEQVLGGDGAERSRWLCARSYLHCELGELDQALTAAREGLELAEACGDADDVASALDQLAIVAHYRGAWREGLQAAIDRLETGQSDAQTLRVFDIHHCISQYHLHGDGLADDVEDYARNILERASRSGARPAEAFGWCLLGERLLLDGRWDEAAAALERSGTIHAELGVRTGALPWQRLAELAACRGEDDAVPVYLRRGVAIATVSPMARHMWGRLYATQAFAALERDDPEAALAAVRSAAAAAARHGDCPTCSALLHPVAAEAHARVGNPGPAAGHAAAAARLTETWESSAWRAMAASASAAAAWAAGDLPAAHERWLSAAAGYDQAAQPFWASRARVHAAGVAADDATRLRLLDGAADRFRELGARRAVERVAAIR